MYRWRMVQASTMKWMDLSLNASGCTWGIYARDGIFLRDLPRMTDHIVLSNANRCGQPDHPALPATPCFGLLDCERSIPAQCITRYEGTVVLGRLHVAAVLQSLESALKLSNFWVCGQGGAVHHLRAGHLLAADRAGPVGARSLLPVQPLRAAAAAQPGHPGRGAPHFLQPTPSVPTEAA